MRTKGESLGTQGVAGCFTCFSNYIERKITFVVFNVFSYNSLQSWLHAQMVSATMLCSIIQHRGKNNGQSLDNVWSNNCRAGYFDQ